MFVVPVWFEPTGVDKAVVPVREGVLDKFQYVSPNLPELRIISETLYGTETNKSPIHGNCVLSTSSLVNHLQVACMGRVLLVNDV